MLSRYTIFRRRPKGAPPLPKGIRQDTRFRTKHILRPTKEIVEALLADGTAVAKKRFRSQYLALLKERYRKDPAAFANLAELATEEDVFLGCNCPTKKNPDVHDCHTWLALQFMQRKFPDLKVKFPKRK
jgi:hypothetical protein